MLLCLFAGLSLIAGDGPAKASIAVPAKTAEAALPAPEPLSFRSVAPQDAVALNAAVPAVSGPNPAATAFSFAGRSEADRKRALDCLTAAVYYEAATEPTDGQRAVAQVVLNRARHPAYPSSVCGVVYQGSERSTGCQFTFTCDGSLRRQPMASFWERARRVAEAALAGQVYAPVGYATHYHTNWVVPYWSSSLAKIGDVGTHIFYRWAGGWGRPSAFTSRPTGAEPVIDLARLRSRMPVASAADPVDVAAATAAARAKADAADPTGAHSASIDSFQRAILRRYEPIPGAAVTAVLADQARDTKPDAREEKSHRWAMTGEGLGTTGAALGRKPADAAGEVKPEPPACLSGVRRSAATSDGAADAC